jgi:hypothetical protein
MELPRLKALIYSIRMYKIELHRIKREKQIRKLVAAMPQLPAIINSHINVPLPEYLSKKLAIESERKILERTKKIEELKLNALLEIYTFASRVNLALAAKSSTNQHK